MYMQVWGLLYSSQELYARLLFFRVCCGLILVILPISFKITSTGPEQSQNCACVIEAAIRTLTNGSLTWIYRSWWYGQNKTKQREYAYFIRHIVCPQVCSLTHFDTSGLGQNGASLCRRYFEIIIFFVSKYWIFIQIWLQLFLTGQINCESSLVEMMAWYRRGDTPLSEPVIA